MTSRARTRTLELHAIIGRIDFARSILMQVHETQTKLYAEHDASLAKQRQAAVAELDAVQKQAAEKDA